jgi:hypothetical protein
MPVIELQKCPAVTIPLRRLTSSRQKQSQKSSKLTLIPNAERARFLPATVIMARSSTGTDALIEILNLCEQTLTALEPDPFVKPDTLRRIKPAIPDNCLAQKSAGSSF